MFCADRRITLIFGNEHIKQNLVESYDSTQSFLLLQKLDQSGKETNQEVTMKDVYEVGTTILVMNPFIIIVASVC